MIIIETLPQPTSNGVLLGKVPNGVRVTDKETGLSVECSGHRSQHANKAEALRMLSAKLEASQEYRLSQTWTEPVFESSPMYVGWDTAWEDQK